jgi:hypothetical protein
VSRVEVRIDGNPVGNATLGLARPDVAAAFGRPDFTNSGWSLSVNIGSLALGNHNVSAVAFNSAGASATLGSRTITVTQTTNQPRFAYMATESTFGDVSAFTINPMTGALTPTTPPFFSGWVLC